MDIGHQPFDLEDTSKAVHTIEEREIVGIDFGTTTTSISCAIYEDHKDINGKVLASTLRSKIVRVDWGDGKTSEQLNICAYYADNPNEKPHLHHGPRIIEDALRKLVPYGNIVRHLKLGLSTNARKEVQAIGDEVRALVRTFSKRRDSVSGGLRDCTVFDVLFDYLDAVWSYAEKQIARQHNRFGTDQTVVSRPVDFVFAVPSPWTNEENANIMQAVSALFQEKLRRSSRSTPNAARKTVRLVSEPIAAVAYLFANDIRFRLFKVGDLLTVLDLGGGTGDVITLRLQQLEPLRCEEEVKGDGDYSGAVCVNKIFLGVVRKAFEDYKKRIYHKTRMSWDIIERRMEEDFDTSKHKFKGKQKDIMVVVQGLVAMPELKDLSRRGFEIIDNGVLVDQSIMKCCYDPVIARNARIIERQVQSISEKTGDDPKHIALVVLLVGGLSRNEYVCAELRKYFRSWSLKIEEPSGNHMNTISDGAVLAKANPFMTMVVPQCSYGVAQDQVYDEAKHGPRYYPEVHGNTLPAGFVRVVKGRWTNDNRVLHRVTWGFKRGQQYSTKSKHELVGTRYMMPQRPTDTFLEFDEPAFMSRTTAEDNLDVKDPRNDIHKIPFSIRIENFAQYRFKSDLFQGERFLILDYRLVQRLDDQVLSLEVYIPKRGSWKHEDDEDDIPVFHATRIYHIGREFQPGEYGEVL